MIRSSHASIEPTLNFEINPAALLPQTPRLASMGCAYGSGKR